MSAKFTCINCRVAFTDADIQRQHYKTDWHRYNLKRKVADLPPVSAEEFQRRVISQREHDEALGKDSSIHCKVCRKTFNSSKSFENHLKSKKHITLVDSLPEGTNSLDQISSPGNSSIRSSASNSVTKLNTSKSGTITSDDDDSDIEEVDSDEWDEEFSDDNPILHNNCLFCNHHSAALMKNMKHMSVAHSFFIPDIEFVTDLKGLLCYLGEKITQGYLCIWCNDSGKAFHSAESAQQHMLDKGHCKMLHEGETLLEYSDYYDYRSSYPEEFVNAENDDEEVETPVIEAEDYQLVLPSGAIIGHRSLMRYYR